MVKLSHKSNGDGDGKRLSWYQCTESLDRRDVLSLKWTNTLLLGSNSSAAIVIKVLALSVCFLIPFSPPPKKKCLTIIVTVKYGRIRDCLN